MSADSARQAVFERVRNKDKVIRFKKDGGKGEGEFHSALSPMLQLYR
jgi:hypothetical protein